MGTQRHHIHGNDDQGYIGEKYGDLDVTDMVIQWSDNPGFTKADRMRFIFTSAYTGASTGMNSLEGLEAMRMWPTFTTGVNIGIGDFNAAGTDPSERLDIITGRVRIRQLPNDLPDNTLTKIMVVDNTGLVKWRDASTLGSGCEWTLQGLPGTNSHISTAYPLNSGCPQMDKGVGIGVQLPKAKLDVFHTDFTGGLDPIAIQGVVKPNDVTANFLGVNGICNPIASSLQALNGYGVNGVSTNCKIAYGVHGESILTSLTGTAVLVGVFGKATANPSTSYALAAGVYGDVSPSNTTTAWAGYFHGNVNATATGYFVNGIFVASDAQLKTNIQPLVDPMSLIMQLQPHQYDFLTEEFPQMSLPSGPQVGMLAQELEEVIPNLVRNTSIAAVWDSLGEEVTPAVAYKAVNYAGLVPYLVGAIQQQQATISQLQDQINQCCASQGSGMAPQGEGTTKSTSSTAQNESDLQEQRLLVQPNPFTDHTTLQYYVPKSGKVSLQVSGSDGRTLGTLREEQADAGAYSYEWNTTQLAPGTYFCTLLVDGNVVVKRAVKVAR